jgi:hypothetical protein
MRDRAGPRAVMSILTVAPGMSSVPPRLLFPCVPRYALAPSSVMADGSVSPIGMIRGGQGATILFRRENVLTVLISACTSQQMTARSGFRSRPPVVGSAGCP